MGMETMIGADTFILFPRRSFVEGFGMLIDPLGASVRYNISRDGNEADTKAMAADWHAVAEDLRAALRTYEAEIEKQD
jgi:hypothetical protein